MAYDSYCIDVIDSLCWNRYVTHQNCLLFFSYFHEFVFLVSSFGAWVVLCCTLCLCYFLGELYFVAVPFLG